jgi:hypothetical protein
MLHEVRLRYVVEIDNPSQSGVDRIFDPVGGERVVRGLAEPIDPGASLGARQLRCVEAELLIVGLIVAVAAPRIEHVRAGSSLWIEQARSRGEALRSSLDHSLTVFYELIHA